MNDNSISRQAAIKAIDEIESEVVDGDGFQYEKWRQYFCELPSAQPRWIPCSERLPEPNEIEENGCLRYYLTQNEYGDMMVCSWNGFKWEQIYQLESTDEEVVAWMPLPKPWKGEEERNAYRHTFIDQIIDIIKSVPSADVPDRKAGKWIDAKPGSGLIGKVCSCCGNEAYWDSDYGQQLFDWCPRCGADMRTSEEENV